MRRVALVGVGVGLCVLVAACSGEGTDGGTGAAGPTGTSTSATATTPHEQVAAVADFEPPVPVAPIEYPPQPTGVAWPTEGWETAPMPEGVDAAAVEARLDEAFGPQSTGPAANFDAVVVVHGGRIVTERYRDGWGDAQTIHRSWSMAKSVTATLIGILVGDGRLDITEPAPVPVWSDPEDPRHDITTDQLLRMASGLEWNETYLDVESDTVTMLSGEGQDDMATYAADKPLEVEPGTAVRYSTGTSNILAGIVGEVVGHGEDYHAFVADELLEPLGIGADEVAPRYDGAGNLVGGSVFDATPRVFAKLGYLHLRRGEWDGQQIVPAAWVDYVRSPTPGEGGNPAYGAHWWIDAEEPGRFYASGLLGQNTVVWPEQDLVIVVVGDRADGADVVLWKDLAELFAAAS